MTWGGGLLALRLEAYRAFVLAFAAGALVASALVDLIPDALELLEKSGTPLQYHQLLFACCMGFLAFYLLEQVTHNGMHAHDLTHAHASQAGLLGATGLGIHSLLDGIAIGEAFHAGSGVGWIVALAVIVHKFADGVSTVGVLVSTGRSARAINFLLIPVSAAPLAGLGDSGGRPSTAAPAGLGAGMVLRRLPVRRCGGLDSSGPRTKQVTLAARGNHGWRGARLRL